MWFFKLVIFLILVILSYIVGVEICTHRLGLTWFCGFVPGLSLFVADNIEIDITTFKK